MCYNKEVSFVIVLFCIALVIKLFMTYMETGEDRYKALALYMIALGVMQLTEFFIHMYPVVKTFGHQLSSICIAVTFIIQAILLLVINYLYRNIVPVGFNTTVNVLFGLYLLFMGYFMVTTLMPNFGKFNSNPLCSNGCRLNWSISDFMDKKNHWLFLLTKLVYIIGLSMVTYEMVGYQGLGALLGLLVFAWLFTQSPIGSFWCITVVVASCLIVIIDPKKFLKSTSA